MFKLIVEEKFDAAHKLDYYKGKCANVHGHTWKVIISIKAKIKETKLNNSGMLLDFGKIKKIIKQFDHRLLLNNTEENKKWIPYVPGIKILDYNPTAENIVRDITFQVKNILILESSYKIEKYEIIVNIFETDKNQVEFGILGDKDGSDKYV